MKAQDPSSTKDVTCPFDSDEPKAVYTISTALPVSVRNRFMDIFMDVARKSRTDIPANMTQLHGHYRELVKVGLKKLDGVYDGKGNKLSMNGSVSDELLDILAEIRTRTIKKDEPVYENLVNWLGSEIWNANTITEEEKKS